MKRRIYLDYNAMAPLLPAARLAMLDALAAANPSSVHAEGRMARQRVEQSRRDIAVLVNGKAEHVVFTSGATEAANMLLTPHWRMGRASVRCSRAYVSSTDHPCVLSGGQFSSGAVERLPVGSDGILDLEILSLLLVQHDKSDGIPLVLTQAVNNETGVVQPMDAIGRLVKEAGGVMIFDAVQAAGRIPLDIASGTADFFILSSHKLGGPQGVGAIVGSTSLLMPEPLLKGGGQERGNRAGTENVPAIVGFSAAAREAAEQLVSIDRMARQRGRIEALVRKHVAGAKIYGERVPRVPNTVFFSIPGVKAETAQIVFDLAGIALSAGSACSSGKVGSSHVLKAMGEDERWGALRVSIGAGTTDEDVEFFGAVLEKLMSRQG